MNIWIKKKDKGEMMLNLNGKKIAIIGASGSGSSVSAAIRKMADQDRGFLIPKIEVNEIDERFKEALLIPAGPVLAFDKKPTISDVLGMALSSQKILITSARIKPDMELNAAVRLIDLYNDIKHDQMLKMRLGDKISSFAAIKDVLVIHINR